MRKTIEAARVDRYLSSIVLLFATHVFFIMEQRSRILLVTWELVSGGLQEVLIACIHINLMSSHTCHVKFVAKKLD